MSEAQDDIYVVVSEHDGYPDNSSHPCGPLVMEQYTDYANHEDMKTRAARLSYRYGKCRIAKLVFTDEVFEKGKKL